MLPARTRRVARRSSREADSAGNIKLNPLIFLHGEHPGDTGFVGEALKEGAPRARHRAVAQRSLPREGVCGGRQRLRGSSTARAGLEQGAPAVQGP